MFEAKRVYYSSEAYERSTILRGPELQTAFLGRTGLEKRVSSGPERQVTLYTAVPIYRRGEVGGAVLVSQTTDSIRNAFGHLRSDADMQPLADAAKKVVAVAK